MEKEEVVRIAKQNFKVNAAQESGHQRIVFVGILVTVIPYLIGDLFLLSILSQIVG